MSELSRPDSSVAIGERRAWVRRACHLEMSGRLGDMRDVHWFGTLLELSPGGLRLLLNRRFEAGALLEIEVNTDDGQLPPPLIVHVIHVSADGHGQWVLGCALEQILTPAEIDRLLGAGAVK